MNHALRLEALGAAIDAPLLVSKAPNLRYLTGFGLMHEDPLQLLGGGLSGGLAELISRSSPAIKGLCLARPGQ